MEEGATSLELHTERLYYSDCYLTEFTARVVGSAKHGGTVYLDRTAFYPASGGQPQDTGVLDGQRILEVIDEGDRIAHVLGGPVRSEVVEGRIDWDRRYDHMQQHTGQHLLSAVLVELFEFQTVSFHLGSEVSTIDLATRELTARQIEAAEQGANEIVREARNVTVAFQDSDSVGGLRKPAHRDGTLRIVIIEGLDRSACGGTHVHSTAELGPIQIRGLEKIRGNVRIEFVCGTRALRRAKQDYRIALELARDSATSIDKLPEHVASLRARLTEAEKDRKRLAIEVARRDGDALYERTPPGADGIRRVRIELAALDDAARAQAQAFAARSKAVLLAVATQTPTILVACSPDTNLHAGQIVKENLAAARGKGGGSGTLAQGSLPDLTVADSIARALGFA